MEGKQARGSPDKAGRVWVGRGVFKKRHARSAVWWFYVRYRLPDGRRRAEKAGTTRGQAERLLKTRLGEVASPDYVDPRQARLTFGQFCDWFLQNYPRQRTDYYSQALRAAKKDKPGGRFRKSGYVFVDGEGKDRTCQRERNRITQRTKVAARAAGLAGVTFHTLRHNAESRIMRSNERNSLTPLRLLPEHSA